MIVYPPEILRLLTPEGFNEAFEEEMPKYKTQSEAYESVETTHEKYFTFRRYSDFESFYQNRNARLRKKLRKCK